MKIELSVMKQCWSVMTFEYPVMNMLLWVMKSVYAVMKRQMAS